MSETRQRLELGSVVLGLPRGPVLNNEQAIHELEAVSRKLGDEIREREIAAALTAERKRVREALLDLANFKVSPGWFEIHEEDFMEFINRILPEEG